VVVETCAEAFCVADAARQLGHETRVVPATLVKTLGVGARRLKTDQRDARALSEVSCRIDLPSVHIPTTESRDRKTMCGMREALVPSPVGITILPFSGGRTRERSDRRARPSATAG
jgi:hypothetical protein